jgi:hypothetical protein
MKLANITGKKFGRLTVLERAPYPLSAKGYWVFKCDCGNEKTITGRHVVSGATKSCGCLEKETRYSRQGPTHPNWRGGRVLSTGGYILVKSAGNPNANKKGYVLEHVQVLADSLRRPLRADESVHHKNGIKNRQPPRKFRTTCPTPRRGTIRGRCDSFLRGLSK